MTDGETLDNFTPWDLKTDKEKAREVPRLEQAIATLETVRTVSRTALQEIRGMARTCGNTQIADYAERSLKSMSAARQWAGQRPHEEPLHLIDMPSRSQIAAHMEWTPGQAKGLDNEVWLRGLNVLARLKKARPFLEDALEEDAHAAHPTVDAFLSDVVHFIDEILPAALCDAYRTSLRTHNDPDLEAEIQDLYAKADQSSD